MQASTISYRLHRERKWAPNLSDVNQLSRSARQLARNSASKIAQPAASKRLGEYQKLLLMERSCKIRRGDLLVELLDGHGLRAIDIARETGEKSPAI